jgi:hypothetical protein
MLQEEVTSSSEMEDEHQEQAKCTFDNVERFDNSICMRLEERNEMIQSGSFALIYAYSILQTPFLYLYIVPPLPNSLKSKST